MTTILLADDNPHAQRMGSEILSQEGHDVVTVADGDAAMQYLSGNRPDLVLADVKMPGASGLDLCRYIKSEPALDQIKVVLLRGPLEPLDSAEAHQVRSDGVLVKPLDAEVLIRTVDSLLDESQRDSSKPGMVQPFAAAGMDGAGANGEGPDHAMPPPSAEKSELRQEARAEVASAFEEALEEVLHAGVGESDKRAQIRAVVSEVLDAVTPSLVDQITDRVLETLQRE